jgi:hypothetical protein
MSETTAQKMLTKNFGLAEFKRRRWAADLDEAQSLEDALEPAFWSHMVEAIMGQDKKGGRGDIIEVYKADTSQFAELLIVEIGVGYVKTKLLRDTGADDAQLPEDAPLKTKWNFGAKTHDVVRADDGTLIQGGFQTKSAAIEWINNHQVKMAA